MAEDRDWYPGTRAGQRATYANIDLKIDGYAVKYPFLTPALLGQIHAACGTFVAAYDALLANRATGRQETAWFEDILTGVPQGKPTPAGPEYVSAALPVGSFIGIEDFTREWASLFKKQLNYDDADGLDLMIEKVADGAPANPFIFPELTVTATNDATIQIRWTKLGFDALELQYRKAGVEMWQPADKSTVNLFVFAPPITTPGTPEKFELRGVYLLKNIRQGEWSPIYTVTVG